jgi:hypothetical protein
VKLALEGGHAELVLAQGGTPATELRVQTHERAVHGFLERIQGQEPEGRLHGRLGRARRALLGQEPGEGAQGHLVQALVLAEQPLLELGLVQREAGEEVAMVEGRGLLQIGQGARLDALLEDRRIDGDNGRVEGNGVRIDAQRVGSGHGAADGRQSLAKAGAGLGLAHVAPEEGGDLVAWVGLTEGHSEIREQSLSLPRR